MDAAPWMDRLVLHLQEQGAISSPAVAEAFRRVPRHRLVEAFYRSSKEWGPGEKIDHNPKNPRPEHLDIIYSDQSLITRSVGGRGTSSASQPFVVAQMLELLELSPGMKVLEVGAGTGYNAALMAELIGRQDMVISVDIQEDVIAQTRQLLAKAGYPDIALLARDGFAGVPERAPYDRIVATVGCPDLSPQWVTQLKPTGFILVPLAHAGLNPLVRAWLDEGRLMGKVVGSSGFMAIQGELAAETSGSAPVRFPPQDAKELPLYDGLEIEHTPDSLWFIFPRGFYYFLGVRDRRAFFSLDPPGYGLNDEQLGTVLIDPEKGAVLLAGDPVLYDELGQRYDEWRDLGKPGTGDYRLEFLPVADPPLPARDGRWTINRKYYRQTLTLS